MASFKAKFPVLQELFAKNHRGGARVNIGTNRASATFCGIAT